MSNPLEVVAGILINPTGAILIQERPLHKQLGGLWEFPGGKLELGEAPGQALVRELFEEIGIAVTKAHPLMIITHDYPTGTIVLHAWRVESYRGAIVGKELQVVRWVLPADLAQYQFPAANGELIKAVISE
jgi:8-oxo-dGTP diphosphatase